MPIPGPFKGGERNAGPHFINTTQMVFKWFQEIGHYPAINVDGGNLKVSCALAAAPDLLLSNNAVKREAEEDWGR